MEKEMIKFTRLLIGLLFFIIQGCSATDAPYYSVSGNETEISHLNTQSDPVVAATATINAAVYR